MSYITLEQYTELYDTIPAADFNRLAWDASKMIDNLTTGVDGVRKLEVAYPTADDAVIRCACRLVFVLYQIEQEEQSMTASSGAVGSVSAGMVSSMSSGSESISFKNVSSSYLTAAADPEAKRKLCNNIIREYLAGEVDANGVNLMYGGVYPCTLTQ